MQCTIAHLSAKRRGGCTQLNSTNSMQLDMLYLFYNYLSFLLLSFLFLNFHVSCQVYSLHICYKGNFDYSSPIYLRLLVPASISLLSLFADISKRRSHDLRTAFQQEYDRRRGKSIFSVKEYFISYIFGSLWWLEIRWLEIISIEGGGKD